KVGYDSNPTTEPCTVLEHFHITYQYFHIYYTRWNWRRGTPYIMRNWTAGADPCTTYKLKRLKLPGSIDTDCAFLSTNMQETLVGSARISISTIQCHRL